MTNKFQRDAEFSLLIFRNRGARPPAGPGGLIGKLVYGPPFRDIRVGAFGFIPGFGDV